MGTGSDDLNSIRRQLRKSNILSAASLAQQQRILGEVRSSNDEERSYRLAMWLQTPDGKHFLEWRAPAEALLAEIHRRDRLWLESWNAEIGRVVSEDERSAVARDRYVDYPTAVRVAKVGKWIALVVLCVCFVLVNELTDNQPDSPLGLMYALAMGGASGFLMWAALYRDFGYMHAEAATKDGLKRRRISHFGRDPLSDGGMDSWSVDSEHRAIQLQISGMLERAGTEFPSPCDLPPLRQPRLVSPDAVAIPPHRGLLESAFGSGGGSTQVPGSS